MIRTRPVVLALGFLVPFAGCGAGNNETPAIFDPITTALVRVEPGDGESSVARNRPVRLVFNSPVLPASVTDLSIRVRTGGSFQTRPEGSFVVSGNEVEFDPTVTVTGGANGIGFPGGAQVLVEVPLRVPGDPRPANEFVQNVEGDPITAASGDNIVAFITGSGWVDPVPGSPGALRVEFTPGPNASNQVPPGAAVTIVFDEPVDPATVLLGRNIFLTNNTDTSPLYQQDVPSLTFVDGSLTRFTFLPVFGFGKGPFNVQLNFIDPDDPSSFLPDGLPTDLGGNRVQNFTFVRTFDTQFNPEDGNTGLLREDFTTQAQADLAGGVTDALWGGDPQIPFALAAQPVSYRIVNLDVINFQRNSQATTAINNAPAGPPPAPDADLPRGNEDYCATLNPLLGPDAPIGAGSPPSADGRRRQNLYRRAEIGASGTIVRIAWGPDGDQTFAASYPGVTIHVGHHRAGTSLTPGSFFGQFDVDGYVKVVDSVGYVVPQRNDVSGGGTAFDGYLNWPRLGTFFEFNGQDDVLVDVAAREGNTYQRFRTFRAYDQVSGFPACTCLNLAGCRPNNSIGLRQMDTTYVGDSPNPAPVPLQVFNPAPFVDVMQFELAKLRSDARSLYYDTGVAEPDFRTPIVTPVVQPGGAELLLTWSASADGIVEDVPFSPGIDACDGFRHIRFHAVLRSNLFTLDRARVSVLEIPFTFE